MSNEVIFGTQIVTIVGFVIALFVLYKVLVEQKDAMISLLKERISDKDAKLKELQSQTPDELAKSLATRVELALEEIQRLRADGNTRTEQIAEKEAELQELSERLQSLSTLIKYSDLVCPTCGAPLVRRGSHTIHGWVGGSEAEADIEYREYECGYAVDDNRGDLSHCPDAKAVTPN
jgi:hypothetical protein